MVLRIPAVLGKGAPTSWPVRLRKEYSLNNSVILYNKNNKYNHCLHLHSLVEFIFSKKMLKEEFEKELLVLSAQIPISIEKCTELLLGSDAPNILQKNNGKNSPVINPKKAIVKYAYKPWTVAKTLKQYVNQE